MHPTVEAYAFTLDAGDDIREADWAVLDAQERAQADRYRFDVHRRRYCVGRAELRRALAERVDCAPNQIRFSYGEQGKPRLAEADRVSPSLHFNLSHSEGTALLAFADTELGADIELVRPGFAGDDIAERYFAPTEVTALRALPVEHQERGFFRCWTRKEAYLKAHGGGLHVDLASFTVEFADALAAPRFTWFRSDLTTTPSEWSLIDVGVQLRAFGIDAEAAIAINAPNRTAEISLR